MGLNALFFDTYAFFELWKGNPSYEPYNEVVKVVTSKMNLMELYYWMYRTQGKQIADSIFDMFAPSCVEISDEYIKEAMVFRALHKEKKLSYVDCIGYILALRNGVRFLTGDKQFKGMPNVEFVP